MHVSRNPIDAQVIVNIIKSNDDNINNYFEQLQAGNFLVVRGIERLSLDNLYNSAALNYPVDKQLYYLDLFIDASLAKYQMLGNIGRQITISLSGTSYLMVPPDKNYWVSEQNWLLGYMAALAHRKMAIVKLFCAVDLDLVHQKKDTKGGEYILLFAKFLQRLFINGEPHADRLLAASGAIKEGTMPESTYEYALYTDGPLMDIFKSIFVDDEKEFNERLLEALELHKKYWAKQPANSVRGLLSLPLTALCVMAKDYDFKIDHTSDYLLQFLIDK
ncbi:MAG: immunity 49 family protein [Mucilaginibacter sp.]|nr:immunity 49 family protein [Mucilaginibacter sp.]